jgi:hypothetical protein
LLEALEAFNKTMGDPVACAKMARAALAVTADVGVHRTVEDMKKLYAQLK